MLKYTIFKTKWGYFALAGTEKALLRTFLPARNRKAVVDQILTMFGAAQLERCLFTGLQERIIAYFEGYCVNFGEVPVVLEGFSPFARRVLAACRKIRYGEMISYGQLAEKAGKAWAARAIGGVMARNPLPLIIPCHRVVRSDGKIGGFSAAGGVKLKKRMLELEGQRCGKVNG